MKPAEKAAHALKSWLNTEEGFDYIRQLTAHYSRACLQDSTLTTYLDNRFSCDPVELRQEIAQEFLEFLVASFLSQLDHRPDQVAMILSDQVSKVLRFALNQFSWKLKDLARQNKRILTPGLTSIGESGKSLTTIKTFFSTRIRRIFCPILLLTAAMNFVRIRLFLQAWIIRIYLYRRHWTKEGIPCLPPNILPRPLSFSSRKQADIFHPWINRNHPDTLENAPDRSENIKTAEEQFDQITALDSIAALAVQFSLGLDEQSCRIFVWRLDDPPVSLEEIARRLDMANHNRVYRIHEKTIAALKKFTSSWPGPPLEELPEDVGLAFIEAIKNICEKSVH